MKQRRGIWWVRKAVPKVVRAAAGRSLMEQSLGTRNKAEANRLKRAVLDSWDTWFDQLRTDPRSVTPAPQHLVNAAKELHQYLQSGEITETDADASMDEVLERLRSAMPEIRTGDESPATSTAITNAFKALRGQLAPSLKESLADFLQERSRDVTAQTIEDLKRRIEAFIGWAGGDLEVTRVDRRLAGRYVTEVVQKRDTAAATRTKEVSALRTFFAWLLLRGSVESNPFDRMTATVKTSKRGKEKARRPWTPEELEKLLGGLEVGHPVWALTALALYTGMRREEVAQLRVEHYNAKGGTLSVTEGKTAAAIRDVPVHPAIVPLVKHLVDTSPDGFLISGVSVGGSDQKRGWQVGKRFGRDKVRLGFTDARLDFHALRGTFVTQMEERSVPLSTIQQIVGHERAGVTLGIYSGGVSLKVRKDAVKRVSFGKVDSLVKEKVADLRKIRRAGN